MSFVIDPAPQTCVPTTIGGAFPVSRIFCIGKNYADHIREMGDVPEDTPPVFFIKHADTLICPTPQQMDVEYPPYTDNLHFEGEIVLAMKSGGADLTETDALSHVWGMGLGCDMTRRDMQDEAKARRAPWGLSKSFDGAAILGALQPGISGLEDIEFTLDHNGERQQFGRASHMIFSPSRILVELSKRVALRAGDLVFTGTPEGVSQVSPGDTLAMDSPDLPGFACRFVI